ncbi:unnamed protein product, partial [Allacma fusca]
MLTLIFPVEVEAMNQSQKKN